MASKLEKLKQKFDCVEFDWMNFQITKSNPLTFHHIDKACTGGERTLKNGALLTNIAHEYLHIIEVYDKKTYDALNKVFKLINLSGKGPTDIDRMTVEYLLSNFYEKYKYEKNSKGEKLLTGNYFNRL